MKLLLNFVYRENSVICLTEWRKGRRGRGKKERHKQRERERDRERDKEGEINM